MKKYLVFLCYLSIIVLIISCSSNKSNSDVSKTSATAKGLVSEKLNSSNLTKLEDLCKQYSEAKTNIMSQTNLGWKVFYNKFSLLNKYFGQKALAIDKNNSYLNGLYKTSQDLEKMFSTISNSFDPEDNPNSTNISKKLENANKLSLTEGLKSTGEYQLAFTNLGSNACIDEVVNSN